MTVFKPHHQTESQYFDVKEPQELRSYQNVQRKVNKCDHSHEKIHKLSIMNDMLTSNYDELYDELQTLKCSLGSREEVMEDELILKKTCWELESIFNLEMLEAMNKMHQIGSNYRQRSPVNSLVKKGHHQSSSSFFR